MPNIDLSHGGPDISFDEPSTYQKWADDESKVSLLMFSPGIDSTYALVKLLSETKHQVMVHHVHFINDEGRYQLEAERSRKIIAECQKHYRPFFFSESAIDHRRFPFSGYDLISVGFEVGIVAHSFRLGRGKMIDGWTIGTCLEEGLDEPQFKQAKACCAANSYPYQAPPFFMLPVVPKMEAAEFLSPEIRDLCSHCRRPVRENGKLLACGECQTCLMMMGIEQPVLLLQNPSMHESAIRLYDDVAARLVKMGHRVKTSHGARSIDFASFDCLISRDTVPAETRSWKKTLAGARLERPQELNFLKENELPVMNWSLAKNAEEVAGLFEKWGCKRLLLKKSFTYAGDGVSVFTKEHSLEDLNWDPEKDIFCAEVNEDDGNVYKAELFNGEIMITWLSEAPPLRELGESSYIEGIKGVYGERELFEFPPPLIEQLKGLSRKLTEKGIGYVSVDLMKDAEGVFRGIEINHSMIATWWTVNFEEMKDRYATAISDWLME